MEKLYKFWTIIKKVLHIVTTKVSWLQTKHFIKCLDEAFKDEKFDCVYAIARGGAVLGTMFSYYRDIPIRYACISSYNHESKENEPIFEQHATLNEFKNILVIDDIIDSGETINIVKNVIAANAEGRKFTYAVMYATPEHKDEVDYYQSLKYSKDQWIDFPWEQEKKNEKLYR